MNLLKKEKKFWQRHFRIDKLEDIPKEWSEIVNFFYDPDDDYFYFISLRVQSVLKIDLKESFVTDEGIKHISKLKKLATLNLRRHDTITKESIPSFNKMESLKSLNITQTKITLTDICELLNNQNLKEVFISSDEKEEDILEKAFILKENLPNCNIYLNTCFTIDAFGNPENPIF